MALTKIYPFQCRAGLPKMLVTGNMPEFDLNWWHNLIINFYYHNFYYHVSFWRIACPLHLSTMVAKMALIVSNGGHKATSTLLTSTIRIDRNCDVLPIEYDLLIVMFVNINITITIIVFFLTNKISCHQQYVTFQSFACVLFSLFCMVTWLQS